MLLANTGAPAGFSSTAPPPALPSRESDGHSGRQLGRARPIGRLSCCTDEGRGCGRRHQRTAVTSILSPRCLCHWIPTYAACLCRPPPCVALHLGGSRGAPPPTPRSRPRPRPHHRQPPWRQRRRRQAPLGALDRPRPAAPPPHSVGGTGALSAPPPRGYAPDPQGTIAARTRRCPPPAVHRTAAAAGTARRLAAGARPGARQRGSRARGAESAASGPTLRLLCPRQPSLTGPRGQAQARGSRRGTTAQRAAGALPHPRDVAARAAPGGTRLLPRPIAPPRPAPPPPTPVAVPRLHRRPRHRRQRCWASGPARGCQWARWHLGGVATLRH
mmetsp:Transcript_1833/g.4169  ORF Transcript_1833/g.4169 Transcript_1833/m.4169 type:complete len:330 (-) Transcript_1833:383-1372(-)